MTCLLSVCTLASASEQEVPPAKEILKSILKKIPKSRRYDRADWDTTQKKRIKVTLGVPCVFRMYRMKKEQLLKSKYESYICVGRMFFFILTGHTIIRVSAVCSNKIQHFKTIFIPQLQVIENVLFVMRWYTCFCLYYQAAKVHCWSVGPLSQSSGDGHSDLLPLQCAPAPWTNNYPALLSNTKVWEEIWILPSTRPRRK